MLLTICFMFASLLMDQSYKWFIANTHIFVDIGKLKPYLIKWKRSKARNVCIVLEITVRDIQLCNKAL